MAFANNELISNKDDSNKSIAEMQKLTKEEVKILRENLKYKESKKDKGKIDAITNGDITEEQIDSLSDAMVRELSRENGEIVSIQVTERNLDNDVSDSLSSGSFSIMTMPTSDFVMTTVVQRLSYWGPSYDDFKFTTEGQWLTDPVYEFTDTIALAWSDSFTLYDDEAYIVLADYPYIDTNTVRNDVVPEVGVGYDIDMQTGRTEESIILYAKVYKYNSTDTANVVGEYGHVEVRPSGVDIGFSSSPDVSMSVGLGSYVNMASPDYAYFSY
jgi:hypothetical protein